MSRQDFRFNRFWVLRGLFVALPMAMKFREPVSDLIRKSPNQPKPNPRTHDYQ